MFGQEVGPWYIPSLGSVNEIAFRAGDGYDGVSPRTHSDLSATWKTGNVETFVEYDLVNKQFCGGRMTWKPSEWFTLYGGILKNPYILELSVSPRNLEAVGYSQSASYLGGYGSDLSGVSARGRDVGIMCDLKLLHKETHDILRIQAGIFNGNGFSFIDDNRYKDLSGRIDIHPMKEMTIALGCMRGFYTLGDGRGKAYDSSGSDADHAMRLRTSAAFWWDDGTNFLRMESTRGDTDGLRTGNTYILAGRWFGEHISPSARYERYVYDLDNPSATHTLMACLTYRFNADMNARIQIDHRYFMDGADAMTWLSLGLNVRL